MSLAPCVQSAACVVSAKAGVEVAAYTQQALATPEGMVPEEMVSGAWAESQPGFAAWTLVGTLVALALDDQLGLVSVQALEMAPN
ncbi:MAG: hypothetical protein JKY25_07710 [Robiginitomaculum sp.]|nr:hypothetical protein [Robiginitomaculum sp.]